MKSWTKRLGKARFLGPGGIAWLVHVLVVEPILRAALVPVQKIRRQLLLRKRYANVDARFSALKAHYAGVDPNPGKRTRSLRELCPELDDLIAKGRRAHDVVPLALIDRHGPRLPLHDVFWTDSLVPAVDFRPGYRHTLLVVDLDGNVGVLKSFRGRRAEFVNELEVATALTAAGCSVPDILKVDFERLEIVFSYVHGTPLRVALCRAGARIEAAPRSSFWRRLRFRFSRRPVRGSDLVSTVLPKQEVDAIGEALLNIHHTGYTLEDVKYGNIVLEEGSREPVFIDFERAVAIAPLSSGLSIFVRDRDATKLNTLVGTELLTFSGLKKIKKLPGDSVYAPVHVGQGLWWGAIWNPDVGIGRWRYLMRSDLSIPRGGRVLDLGANNGFNALQMLRGGAAEVVAVELDPRAIEQGLFLKRVWEWHDNRSYDLTFVQGSHGSLPALGLGRFDQVTAFCTLYYLSREEMEASVRFIRTITDTFVQQANTDTRIRRKNEDTFRKASLEFTIALAKAGGFAVERVVAPRGYSRPLVIGSAQGSDTALRGGRTGPMAP